LFYGLRFDGAMRWGIPSFASVVVGVHVVVLFIFFEIWGLGLSLEVDIYMIDLLLWFCLSGFVGFAMPCVAL
jgi:hypothetical protein